MQNKNGNFLRCGKRKSTNENDESKTVNQTKQNEGMACRLWKAYPALKLSDRVLFRKVTDRGLPESVESAYKGKKCTVITGHKDVEMRNQKLLRRSQEHSLEVSDE